MFEIETMKYFFKTFSSGMYYLINFIDTEIIRLETGNKEARIDTKYAFTPNPAYKISQIYQNF